MLKKILAVCLIFIMSTSMLVACGNDEPEVSSTPNPEEVLAEMMDDGMIQGTNAQEIENALKSVPEYDWWEDHSLTQSQRNKEWSVLCGSNDDTKSYSLDAHDTLEIEIAKFTTWDDDYDYLLLCASHFDTELIDAEAVKAWIIEFNREDGSATEVFGDAEFTMYCQEYDDGDYSIELQVWACGDINSN